MQARRFPIVRVRSGQVGAMDIAQRFIDALHTLEADRDPDPLAELYAADAIAGNTATTTTPAPKEFWSGYRDAFDEIRSDFRHVVTGDDAVALEWVSTGRLAGGGDIEYEGAPCSSSTATASPAPRPTSTPATSHRGLTPS